MNTQPSLPLCVLLGRILAVGGDCASLGWFSTYERAELDGSATLWNQRLIHFNPTPPQPLPPHISQPRANPTLSTI